MVPPPGRIEQDLEGGEGVELDGGYGYGYSYGEDHHHEYDFSSPKGEGEAGKVDGKKAQNQIRSKHSETEQRRRSKINERFQTLRDLIPQNNHKRDKASFLLEVIDYIRFLQDKLQMYEGTYLEPTKHTPWGNNSVTADNHVEPAQDITNGASLENNAVENSSGLLTQDSLLPDLENSAVSLRTQSNIFASVGRDGISGLTLEPFPSTGSMTSHPQSQMWLDAPFSANCLMHDDSQSEAEQLLIRSESDSLSSAYSQGILNTLTQALQNSGVDLSQTCVSVQIDVGKGSNIAAATASSNLKSRSMQRSYVEKSKDEQTS